MLLNLSRKSTPVSAQKPSSTKHMDGPPRMHLGTDSAVEPNNTIESLKTKEEGKIVD